MEQILRVTAAALKDFSMDVELLSNTKMNYEKHKYELQNRNEEIVKVYFMSVYISYFL